ncbi:MAG: bifunctional 5,10-methylenetetrahydrofolate dehydrogenase/5,10-methenyltetrahydrofolate cyclohydrolase [Chloroflexi bacterium]|nr:bifunctional 5,10-methylenetetrahydrofolate dehydrogenase/5,10-methenyltetrahydrofolate cyclohydrolase [Chloroflexota bacterium]
MSRSLAAKPRSTALAAEAARIVAKATAARGGRPAVLAAVVATEEIDALIYMEQLLKQAATAGLAVKKISLAATASEAEISATLQRLSGDPDVAGIILQSPLPSGVDRARVVVAIDPQKDVDGATEANAARLAAGDLDGTILPATAAAVMELLRVYEIPLRGQRAVVVGRSAVVGRPVAQLFALAGAHVEVVHSKTPDMGAITRTAQILVVAAGVRGLVRGEHVAQGCVVIDVGIHADGDRIVGDVDVESVSVAIGESGALSPVPGGVGPMTNAILVLQAAQAAARRAGA